jgi:hypothetical protein
MPISYKDVNNERQWKATTGLSEKDFFSLSAAFQQAYEMMHEVSLQQGAENLKMEVVLNSYEQALYFVLFQLKNGLTWDSLGVSFGMEGSNACRNFQKYLKVLEGALRQKGALPKRSFQSVIEFKKYMNTNKEIVLDATEYRTERPADKEKQQDRYSGKKKPIH